MGSRRNRRRGRPKDAATTQQPQQQNGNGDRYQKFLPSWMRDGNGAVAARPPRPRRVRPPRSKGGYTPGKLAVRDAALDI